METIVRSSEDIAVSAISWRAILAGAVASAALTLMLLALGAGIGLSVVSPYSTWTVTTTQAALGAGIFMLVVAVMSSAVGGYIAGRLRTRWAGVHTNEVYFRDTAHGLVSWAVATVVSAAFLGSAAALMAGGAASGAAAGASLAAGTQSETVSGYVDRLLRPDYAVRAPVVTLPATATPPSTNPTPIGPAQNNPASTAMPAIVLRDVVSDRNDMGRLLAVTLRDRTALATDDRTYLAQMVAARTGLSQADAAARVNDTLAQLKANADIARRASAQLALWLAASMLLGAFAAGFAATEGGALRDGTFKYDR